MYLPTYLSPASCGHRVCNTCCRPPPSLPSRPRPPWRLLLMTSRRPPPLPRPLAAPLALALLAHLGGSATGGGGGVKHQNPG